MSTIFSKTSNGGDLKSRQKRASTTPANGVHMYGSDRNVAADRIWNTEETLNNFNKSGDLPPILSPTLPSWASKALQHLNSKRKSAQPSENNSRSRSNVDNDDDENYDIPKLMLSPTLPGIFDKYNGNKSPPELDYADQMRLDGNFEKKQKIGPHYYIVRHENGTKSFRLCLFMRPRLLRQVKKSPVGNVAKPPKLAPAAPITTMKNRKNVDEFYSDSDDSDHKPAKKSSPAVREIGKPDVDTKSKAKDIRKERVLPKGPKDLKERERERERQRIKEKERAKIPPKPTPRPTFSTLPEQLLSTKIKAALLARKKTFSDLATQKKHEADKIAKDPNLKNSRLLIITTIDSILLFMAAFIYDDKMRTVERLVPNERQWLSLIPYLSQIIFKLEAHKSDVSLMLGLCYQLRAAVKHHIKIVFLKRTNNYVKRKQTIETSTDRIEEDEVELKEINHKLLNQYYPKLQKMNDELELDFLKGEKFLSMNKLDIFLYKTYSLNNKFQNSYFNAHGSGGNGDKSMIEYFDSRNDSNFRDLLDSKGNNSNVHSLLEKVDKERISEKSFYLPFNPFLDPQQVVSYGYLVTKEWADKYNVNYEWRA